MSRMMRCEAVVTVTFDDRKLNDLPRSRNQSRSWPVVAPAVNNSCHSLNMIPHKRSSIWQTTLASASMASCSESELYAPVKQFLELQGHTGRVRSLPAIRGCR